MENEDVCTQARGFPDLLQKMERMMQQECSKQEGGFLRKINANVSFTVIRYF